MSKSNGSVPLVVTTVHRGVFFGYGTPTDAKTIRLTNARMCVYWSADMKGVMGLASGGPSKSCRVGPAIPALTLNDVTAVMECSDEARKSWEGEPWQ
jgi:hypothetical protein